MISALRVSLFGVFRTLMCTHEVKEWGYRAMGTALGTAIMVHDSTGFHNTGRNFMGIHLFKNLISSNVSE